MNQRANMLLLGCVLVAANALAQAPGTMPALPSMPAMPVEPTSPTVMPVMEPTPAPAAALPEVNIPSVTAISETPAPPLPTLDEPLADSATMQAPAPTEDTLLDPEGAQFSYGTTNFSLLYTPNQINKMKSVLAIYETSRRNQTGAPIKVVEDLDAIEEIAPVIAQEPDVYPTFTLKSIAFRNNRDWTVWIGNLRITPSHNDQEVRVIGIMPNMGQFLWKPPYREALQQRVNAKLMGTTEKVSHKQTRPNTAIYDGQNGQVSFTLRPNQTFAPAYMATFEGKIASPNLPKLNEVEDSIADAPAGEALGAALGKTTNDTSAANPANLDALLRAQQQSPMVRAQPSQNQPAPVRAPIN